jgi:NAD-dependent dihydropyrimidine dehydrogenase PreA subunit
VIGLFRRDPPAPSYPVLPEVNERAESNIAGLYLLGDVAGRPLIKVGLNDGYDLADRLADDLESSPRGAAEYDVVIVGAGVDVMAFAKNGQPFSNRETSCIHCGICITVCPMDVLKFEQLPNGGSKVTVDVG